MFCIGGWKMVGVNQPIDMITLTNNKGIIKPVKMRVTDKNGDEHVFPLKVVTRDIEQQGKGTTILKFICRFATGTISRECELHFRIQETRWMLYRIIK
jgi:hypothetical protein